MDASCAVPTGLAARPRVYAYSDLDSPCGTGELQR